METRAVSRVLKYGKLSRGKETEKFECEFSAYTKQKYAIAVNSGTSGLHLAVRALGWKKGDEIITTPFSYIATANAVLLEGARPVFVDIDPLTLNIDVSKIEKKINGKTRGILLAHIFGLPVYTNAIKKLKEKYRLQIIEDACEAIGQPDNTFRVTELGDISVYGFHENKQLTTGGEGGMITTNNPLLAQKCYSLRDQGRSTKKRWINNVILGFNFRITEMQAAFGRAQLKSLDQMLKKRNQIAQKYTSCLKGIADIITPNNLNHCKRSWFIYFVLFSKSSLRDLVHKTLARSGVSSSINYFHPIYKFPMYKYCRAKDYKNTEDVSKRILALPIYYQMTDTQVKYITGKIKRILNG